MKKTTKQHGFTLVEILIAIAIVSILAGAAVPYLRSWLPNVRLKAAARDLTSDLQNAKIEAVKRNANVVVSLTPVSGACPANPVPGGGYQVFVDNGAGLGAGNNLRDADEPILATVTMPANVSFCESTVAGNITGFRPNGLVINTGTLTLENNQNGSYALTLTVAGGIRLE